AGTRVVEQCADASQLDLRGFEIPQDAVELLGDPSFALGGLVHLAFDLAARAVLGGHAHGQQEQRNEEQRDRGGRRTTATRQLPPAQRTVAATGAVRHGYLRSSGRQ